MEIRGIISFGTRERLFNDRGIFLSKGDYENVTYITSFLLVHSFIEKKKGDTHLFETGTIIKTSKIRNLSVLGNSSVKKTLDQKERFEMFI